MYRPSEDDTHFFMMLGVYVGILAMGAVIFLIFRWWKDRRDFPRDHRKSYARNLVERLSKSHVSSKGRRTSDGRRK